MAILSNIILSPQAYAEAFSNLYPLRCSTLNEEIDFLRANCIYISKGYDLTEIPAALAKNPDRDYVFVEFSLEENYTVYNTRMMPVQKRYLARVKKFLRELEKEQASFNDNTTVMYNNNANAICGGK